MRKVWNTPILIAVVTASLALIGVGVGSYLTYYFGLKSQLMIADHQKRQQTFSELMGRKILTKQLYVSRFEALIYSDYHEARWKLTGSPKDSIDLQEAQRWMHRSEELVFDIAKNQQRQLETVGLIRILFNKTSKLDELIDRIVHFKTPKISGEPFKRDANQLEEWKVKAVQQLQAIVDEEYGAPVNTLLNYLEEEIHKTNP